MGDIADDLSEQGQGAYWAHCAGECEGQCPYCDEEESDEENKP